MNGSTQSLTFSVAEESGELHARFDPAAGKALPDVATFKQRLADAGFGDLYLDDLALADFARLCSRTQKPLDQVIGERRDGKFTLTLSDDQMSAYLTLTPPQGGKPAGPAVLDALREKNVSFGILTSQLDAAQAAGHCENLLIAQGEVPQDGVATRFENLFEAKRKKPVSTDKNVVIQLASLGSLLLVQPGDALMRRTPATAGKGGVNIHNQVVMSKVIEDALFNSELPGAALDPNDPDLLVATIAGQPVVVYNGVKVNEVIEVADVDISTGNIVFDGSVKISADIKSGMSINVTGDVTVNGTVEAAKIVAGGNVTVHGGIIGHADTRSGTQNSLPENTARIICKGTVQALFMENVHVEARESILIEQVASKCELMAGNEIVVGKEGSRTSKIIGGVTQAAQLVRVGVLGSPTGARTRVEVDIDPYLDEVIGEKKRLMQQKNEGLDQALKLHMFIRKNPEKDTGGIVEKTENTCRQLAAEIAAMKAELAELNAKEETIFLARVEVGKEIHAGVEIRVGPQVMKIDDDMSARTFKLQEGEIVTS